MIPAPVPAGPAPWGQPGPGPAPVDASKGSPWIVALTIGLAVLVVGLVALGLRAAAGRSPSAQVTEVPARRDIVPPPSSAGPSTSNPSFSPTTTPTTVPGSSSTTTPGTTTPGGTGTTGTTVPGGAATPDLVTPRLKFTELDGRFEVTVPRSWVNEPSAQVDQAQWVPLAPAPAGGLGKTDFLFAVRWGPSEGCKLEQCAAVVVDRMKTTYPGIIPTTTADTLGGLPAIRIDATFSNTRLVAWIVVKGDRFWVPQMRGPVDDFDVVLTVLRTVVATMSFG